MHLGSFLFFAEGEGEDEDEDEGAVSLKHVCVPQCKRVQLEQCLLKVAGYMAFSEACPAAGATDLLEEAGPEVEDGDVADEEQDGEGREQLQVSLMAWGAEARLPISTRSPSTPYSHRFDHFVRYVREYYTRFLITVRDNARADLRLLDCAGVSGGE